VKRKPKRTVGLFLAGAKFAKVLLTVLSSTRNLYKKHPEKARELKELLEQSRKAPL
jgi:hypothetical protein